MSMKTSPIQLYDSDDDDDLLTQPDFLEGWEAPSPSKAEKRGVRRRGQSPEKLAAKRTKDDSVVVIEDNNEDNNDDVLYNTTTTTKTTSVSEEKVVLLASKNSNKNANFFSHCRGPPIPQVASKRIPVSGRLP